MSISTSILHRIRRGATRLALLMLASPAFAQPTAGLDVIVVPSGTVATALGSGKLSVLANDSNHTGGRLVAKFGSSPMRGTLNYLNPDGTFSYSHGGGAFADSFKYRSCDQNDVCSIANVAITTTAQDFAPSVGDDVAQVLPGGTVSVLDSGQASVLANDSEPNGQAMTLQMVVPPSHGTANLAADGKFSYTHDGSPYFDSLQYKACDPQNQCATGTVLFHTTSNNAPAVQSDAIVVAPSTASSTLASGASSLLANDSDQEGEAMVAAILHGSGPLHGSAIVNNDGTFSYTRGANSADDSFQYVACDIHETCTLGKVFISTTGAPATLAPPTISKSFGAASVAFGGSTTLTLHLSNPNTQPIVAVSLVDNYPAGLKNAAVGALVSNSCGGSAVAPDAGTSVALTGGVIAAGASCHLMVKVVGTAAGTLVNQTGSVTSSNAASAPGASASLTVAPPLPADLSIGQSLAGNLSRGQTGAPFVLTVSNVGGVASSGQVSVVDTLPAGLTAYAIKGSGWICTMPPTFGCTRSDALAAGASYPPIYVLASVAGDAAPSVTNKATVSNAGDANHSNNVANLSVTVSDDPLPVASNDAIGILPGGTATKLIGGATSVLSNDSDPSGGALTAVPVGSNPMIGVAGSLLLNPDGTFSYTNTDMSPQQTTDFFHYQACDANGACSTALVTVIIDNDLPPQLLPAAVGDAIQVGTGGTATALLGGATSVLTNDKATLAYGDALWALPLGAGPKHGTLTLAGPSSSYNGTFKYVHDGSASTSDSFQYQACSVLYAVCTAATVTITIGDGPLDQVPVAINDAIGILPGGTSTKLIGGALSVLTNDTDADGDTLIALPIGPNPMIGTAGQMLLHPDGTFTYTNTDVSPLQTTDFFHYQACDSHGACATAAVTVIINANGVPQLLPAAVGDAIQVGTGGTATALLGGATSVLTNDKATLAYGDALWALPLGAGPKHGTLTLAGPSSSYNGTFKYVHDGSASTSDSFQYQACSVLYAVCTAATVTITIGDGPLDQVPVAVNDAIGILPGGTSTKLIGGALSVLTNDSDPDGDTLIALPIGPNPMIGVAGQMLLHPDGTFTYTNTDVSPLQTTDFFHYQACDSHGACATAAVTVIINANGVPQLLPAAVGDAIQVGTGGTATALLGGATSVLTNDKATLAYGDALWALPLGAGPKHGTLTLAGPSSSYNGTFKYVHDGSASTSDSFQYQACSVLYAVCTAATVTITIGDGPLDQVPVAVNDAIGILPGGTSTKLIGGATSVLTNDSDPDGDTLIALPIGPNPMIGVAGQMLLNPDGTFTYTNTDVSPLQTTDFFHYQACDSHGACATAAVTVIISDPAPPQTLPSAVGDAIQVSVGGTANTVIGGANSLLANDATALSAGDALWALPLGSGPKHGTLTLAGPSSGYNGTFKYVHDGSASTSDSFQYQACSVLYAVCTSATVTITIGDGPADQLPVAVNDAVSVLPGGNATTLVGGATSVLANDSDPDGDTLVALPIGPNPMLGAAGEMLLNPDGSFSYTNTVVSPLHTSDVFHYQACDSFGACDIATLSVAIGVPLLAQTIDLTSSPPSTASIGDSYAVVAAASSGLPVSLTIDATSIGVCTITGSVVTFIDAGDCTIVANQDGDATFAAAASVTQTVAVLAATGTTAQTIAFNSAAPNPAVVGGTYNVSASASSGLPVALTIGAASSGVCTISGSAVAFTGAGSCVIVASQAGNETYAAASEVSQTVAIAAAPGTTTQTITIHSFAPNPAIVGGTYAVLATASSGLPVALNIDSTSTGVCTITGNTVIFIDVGSCVVVANQGGDATFTAAPQVTQVALVEAAQGTIAQTITIDSNAPNPAIVGDTYDVIATASSGLPVSLAIDSTSTGVCTITGSTVTFIDAGSCVIVANQGGNAMFAAAPQVSQVVLVEAAQGTTAQTITIESIAPNPAIVGSTYDVLASASSGLPVSLTIDSSSAGVCTITGSTVTFIGAGNCVIVANQGGNATFSAAPQATQAVMVEAAPGTTAQTITIESVAPSPAVVGGTYDVLAAASSGLPVSLTIDSSSAGVCMITGSTVTFIGAGSCVIAANQGGDATFAAAPEVLQTVQVGTAPGVTAQTITIDSVAPNPALIGGTYGVIATASSGLPVTLTIDAASTGVCTISGSTVTFVGAGNCVIVANQSGDATFAAAPQVTQTVLVTTAPDAMAQTITFDSTAPNPAFVGADYDVVATASSGLPVTLTIDAASTGVCTIAGSSVSFVAEGNCVIVANQAGDASFAAAPQVTQIVTVEATQGETVQTVTIDSTPPLPAIVGSTYTVLATASSGLPVALTIDAAASAVCTIAGSVVTFTGTGTCIVHADQSGDATFSAAPQATQSFAITSPPTIAMPQASDDAFKVHRSGSFNTTAGAKFSDSYASVLGNDRGTSLTAVLVTPPAHAASITLNADGTLTYLNNGDAAATDSFTYHACDAQDECSLAVVFVTIVDDGTSLPPANGEPPLAADDAFDIVTADTLDTTAAGVLRNGYSSVLANDRGQGLKAVLLVPPAHATAGFALNPNGTFSYSHNGDNAVNDSFVYEACEANGACSVAAVLISILPEGTELPPVDTNAPLAVDDALQVAPGGLTDTSLAGGATFIGGARSVLSNDIGQGLKAIVLTEPAHAALFQLRADGAVVYRHANDGTTSDSFSYQACNAHASCSPAIVRIVIEPGNNDDRAPVAADDFIVLAAGGSANTLTDGSTSVLANDTDADGDALHAILLTQPQHGSVSFGSDGGFFYINNGEGSAADRFAYEACDPDGVCSSATVWVDATGIQGETTQSISFDSTAPDPALIGSTYHVVATASSGLPVALTIDATSSAVCTIIGSTVTFIDAGDCVIVANQGGNATFAAAPPATQIVAVAAASGTTAQTITITSIVPNPAIVGGTYNVVATASSGLPVVLTTAITSLNVCTITGTTVAFIGAGNCVIVANQSGNAVFAAAPQVTQSFAILAASVPIAQTITITSTVPNPAIVGGTYNVVATASSGLPVVLTIGAASSTVCTITGSIVSFIGAGSCVVVANQSGNAVFAAAPQVTQSFAILAASVPIAQTITITSTVPNPAIVGGTYNVVATASSGLPVALTIAATSSGVCTIAGTTVTFIGAGNCTVTANQAGNTAFLAAPQATQVVLVGAAQGTAGQTITIDSTPPVPAIAGGTYEVSATASSGLPVTLAIDAASSAVCAISGSTVTFLAAGNCVIVANQGGNANFAAALPVTQTVDIQPAGNAIFSDGFGD
jgi:hypothetical protein